MNIGIDTRMSDPNVGGGGLGRYVEQLVKELPGVDEKNRYVLFQKSDIGCRESDVRGQRSENITRKKAEIQWYTLAEQFVLPRIVDRERLDLVHFPHWNVPVRMKTPFVVTIHDLILLNEPRSARATTLHPFLYAIKYRGFRHVLSHAINASKKIIAVSHATKADILKHFPNISQHKITVIHEGITPLSPLSPLRPSPSLLYIGNCYPHKNIETLLTALQILHKTSPEIHLVIAGRGDAFQKHLQQTASQLPCSHFIHFEQDPSDQRLAELYAGASVYVFPSRIEGFGLPPLEAMSMDVPVAVSDIPSLREILGDAAVFFPPDDPRAMAHIIEQLATDHRMRKEFIQKGREQIKKYSWKKMTQQIVDVYNACANL